LSSAAGSPTEGAHGGVLYPWLLDNTHHLTDDKFDVLRATFTYTHGVPTGYTLGGVPGYTLSPGILAGLDILGAGPVWTSLTDPLSRTSRELMDSSDRLKVAIAGDGGVTTFTRDSNGRVSTVADPLNRVTTFVRDSASYIATTLTYNAITCRGSSSGDATSPPEGRTLALHVVDVA
jgi:YD repeat-containing protein